MSISIRRYVDITSVVGGAPSVRQRDMIARIFTNNPNAPSDGVIEFTGDIAQNVANWFGGDSPEHKIALQYASFISKSATRARKIGFSRLPIEMIPASVIGAPIKPTFESVKSALTALGGAATWGYSVDGNAITVPIGDLTTVTSFTALADSMTAAAASVQTPVTVTFDPVVKNLILTAAAPAESISGDARTAGAQASAILQLTTATARYADPGSVALGAGGAFGYSASQNDNFATFGYVERPTLDQLTEIAQVNAGLNFKFLQSLKIVDPSEATSFYDALKDYGGTGMSQGLASEVIDVMPMAIAAATDWTRRAANRNYGYQTQAGYTATVTDDTDADFYKSKRANFYGQTMSGGQKIAFYQPGVLMGGSKDATAMNVYINEIWLKDYCTTQAINLLLGVEAVPANDQGAAMLRGQLQEPINAALFNGVIQPGKGLTQLQKAYIEEQTGDPLAWLQVQGIGYWLGCSVQQETDTTGVVTYYLSYLLVYSKGDVVSVIRGSHQLI